MSSDDLTRIAASLPGYRDRHEERPVTTDADLCRVCGHLAGQHEHSTRSTRCSAMQCGCLRPARTRWWHRIADWYQRPPLDLDAMDRHRRGSPS